MRFTARAWLLLLMGAAGTSQAEDTLLRRATDAANSALVAAYADYAKRPDAVAPEHPKPWVIPANAQKQRTPEGTVFSWDRAGTAGFEFSVAVRISDSGEVKVLHAHAQFSPD